jgi:prepilin-type processing-associated H-X9-DG protein
MLPDKDVNLGETLGKHLKDPSLLVGFVYTFKGGRQIDLENPTGTVLGYVEGPGGRAVLYADGHATWVNNKP